ncbi:hypothetical protein FQA39_LY15690 [Lamprigera yunnana]|nr:hypothetical protein FQA39_LY15690 [Lamprigera yunnana]
MNDSELKIQVQTYHVEDAAWKFTTQLANTDTENVYFFWFVKIVWGKGNCDMMWKPRQIGSKTLTFEMIEEKKILRIKDVCGNEVYLGWESVSKIWSLQTVLSYRLSYSSDTISKYIKDYSDSDTSSYSSDEEECKEAVEQNVKDSKTTEKEESKKSEGGRNTKPL